MPIITYRFPTEPADLPSIDEGLLPDPDGGPYSFDDYHYELLVSEVTSAVFDLAAANGLAHPYMVCDTAYYGSPDDMPNPRGIDVAIRLCPADPERNVPENIYLHSVVPYESDVSTAQHPDPAALALALCRALNALLDRAANLGVPLTV